MFPCDWCGWMPEDCPCRANKVTMADLDARHAKAVERANPPVRVPTPERPVVLSGWMRGTVGHSVAHRFRDTDGTSACGMTSSRYHGEMLPVTAFDRRCASCTRSINAAAARMAVAA